MFDNAACAQYAQECVTPMKCPTCGQPIPVVVLQLDRRINRSDFNALRETLRSSDMTPDEFREFIHRPLSGPDRLTPEAWLKVQGLLRRIVPVREEKHSLIRKCKERIRATRPRRDS